MSFRVKRVQLQARDQSGHIRYHKHGDTIAWLSDEDAVRFVRLGLVEPVDGAHAAPAPVAAAPALSVDPSVPRPPQVAAKEQWVDYAVTAAGMDRAAADGMSKADLIKTLS